MKETRVRGVKEEDQVSNSKGNFITGPHGLLLESLDQNRTKVDQNVSRVFSKSVEFLKYY